MLYFLQNLMSKIFLERYLKKNIIFVIIKSIINDNDNFK